MGFDLQKLGASCLFLASSLACLAPGAGNKVHLHWSWVLLLPCNDSWESHIWQQKIFWPLSHQKIKHHTSCQRLVHQGEDPEKKNKKVQDLQCLRRLPVLVKKTRFIWLVVFHQPILNMFTHDFELPPPRNSSFPNMLLTSGRSWRWVFVPLHWTTLQVQPRVEAIGIQRDPWDVYENLHEMLDFLWFSCKVNIPYIHGSYGKCPTESGLRHFWCIRQCQKKSHARNLSPDRHRKPIGKHQPWMSISILEYIQNIQRNSIKVQSLNQCPLESSELCLLPYFNYSTMFLSSRVRQEATEVVLIWFQLTKDCLSKKSPNHINKNLTA